MRKKLGLWRQEADDAEMVMGLLGWMQQSRADFTNTFRDLSEGRLDGERYLQPDFQAWHSRWQQRLEREGKPIAEVSAAMRTVNPAVIPRNHRVEEALSAAEGRDDLSVLYGLLAVLRSPYELERDLAHFREPGPEGCAYRTYCGT